MKFKIIIGLLLISLAVRSQNYMVIKKINKHSNPISAIATNEKYVATGSNDDIIAIWDYSGKNIYNISSKNARVEALTLQSNSDRLFIALTELPTQVETRYIIRSVDIARKTSSELIDTTLRQGEVDHYYENNTKGAQNGMNQVSRAFLSLSIKAKMKIPQVKSGLSHIEYIQNISISPSANFISSIDYFKILKIWDKEGKLLKSYQISNNKSHTQAFFVSDTLIYIAPNLLLNTKTDITGSLGNFDDYMGTAGNKSIYLKFDYNDKSLSEKIIDISTKSIIDISLNNNGSDECISSNDCFAVLGVDGLVQIVNQNGKVLSILGKDRDERITFRSKEIHRYSKICKIGISPNNDYVITGDEKGKLLIWKK